MPYSGFKVIIHYMKTSINLSNIDDTLSMTRDDEIEDETESIALDSSSNESKNIGTVPAVHEDDDCEKEDPLNEHRGATCEHVYSLLFQIILSHLMNKKLSLVVMKSMILLLVKINILCLL